MIHRTSDFLGRRLSWRITLPSLVVISMHCASGNKLFLLVEGQDSKYAFFNPPLLFISKAHVIQCSVTRNFKTLPMKDSLSCSHMSTRTTDGNNLKTFWPFRPNRTTRMKIRRRKTRTIFGKLYCVPRKSEKCRKTRKSAPRKKPHKIEKLPLFAAVIIKFQRFIFQETWQIEEKNLQ